MTIRGAASILVLLIGCSTNAVAACRPDFSSEDRISKQPVVRWLQNLTARGFWKSMVVSDIDLLVIVGRYGDTNAVNVEVVNTENDRDRAAFNSRYRAAVGDRFILGFEGAEPLTFAATEVNNQSEVQNAKGLVMNVILSARLSDGQVAAFRDKLTKHRIDAVRVALSSGMIERSIDEEYGDTMMRKFACFYEYLDERGIELVVRAEEHAPAAEQKLDLVVEDILA
jgi:hypothetical protein